MGVQIIQRFLQQAAARMKKEVALLRSCQAAGDILHKTVDFRPVERARMAVAEDGDVVGHSHAIAPTRGRPTSAARPSRRRSRENSAAIVSRADSPNRR